MSSRQEETPRHILFYQDNYHHIFVELTTHACCKPKESPHFPSTQM